MKQVAAFCAVWVCFAVPMFALDIENPPRGVFSDEWYVLMLDGHKSGSMRSTMERVKRSGRDIIRTKTRMTLAVARAGDAISISTSQSSEETLDGKPLAFESTMQLGRIPSTTKGKIADGKVTVSTRQFGLPMGSNTYDLPEGAIMSWGTYREQMQRGLHPGLKYDLSVYEPTIAPDQLTRTTMEVFEQEEVDLFGRKLKAYRTKQTAHIANSLLGETGIETTTWMTDAGTLVKMEMSVPLIDKSFEVIACSKSVALAADDPAELMVDTLIPADRSIDSELAKSITYRLITKGASESTLQLPETAMQRIVETGDGAITVKLTRRSARPARDAKKDVSASAGPASESPSSAPASGKTPSEKTTNGKPTPDLSEYMEASADVNFKDPVVAALAREAAGDEKDPWKVTQKLCDFVHGYVRMKNLSVGFASASEVARSKEGDCTEHGILLAALGRAMGIPTRIVTGVVYTDEFGGKRDVFVGHLWTQFWLDGEWVDVDAAFGQTDVDPTHIALGVSAAGDSGMADLVTSGWMSLKKLGLKVLEVEK